MNAMMAPDHWLHPMKAPDHCKKCGSPMDKVADFAPQGTELGLRAFLCPECGAVDSVLVHPD
ncbi:MAG TPA: hypothetical protein VKP67_11835, partial [Xanthobacteraceae bacterium]|nr:hypothetical protein [Xanthobacteraceae bacterium]